MRAGLTIGFCGAFTTITTFGYESPQMLGDVVVVTPLLDRLMHYGHLLKFEGKSWRLKEQQPGLRSGARCSNLHRPVA